MNIKEVAKIVKEEIDKYANDLNNEDMISQIKNDIKEMGKEYVYNNIGIEKDRWSKEYKLSNGGKFARALDYKSELISNSEIDNIIDEILPEIKSDKILSILNKQDKLLIRKEYKNKLISVFKEEIHKLASIHGKNKAQTVWKEYIDTLEDE